MKLNLKEYTWYEAEDLHFSDDFILFIINIDDEYINYIYIYKKSFLNFHIYNQSCDSFKKKFDHYKFTNAENNIKKLYKEIIIRIFERRIV